MLQHLRVVNLGLLHDAAIDPSQRFTVVTGETGAGKTLLLGGLRLVMGEPASSAAVGPAGDSVRVDGLFTREDSEVGVSRVVPRDGRSRAYLEGAIVSASTLGERVGGQVEIVGQHDQLDLGSSSRILAYIDSALDDAGRLAKSSYVQRYEELVALRRLAAELGDDEAALVRELDLLRYQAQEIEGAGLVAEEELTIEEDLSRLRNAAEIRDRLEETLHSLDLVEEYSGTVVSVLRKTAELDPAAADLVEDAESVSAQIADLRTAARGRLEGTSDDPHELERLNVRLGVIADLKRKYGKTIEEVVAFGAEAREKASKLEGAVDQMATIAKEIEDSHHMVVEAARGLTDRRRATAEALARAIEEHLGDVGLVDADLSFSFESVDPGKSGCDQVTMLFSSDPRVAPRPVGEAASGGELSRVVLAVRLATTSDPVTTMVFDEIDTGIGGRTASAMGEKLASLADGSQVLCVTHLPQVAAFADTHYVVSRDGGVTKVALVEGEARIDEITRMLAGLQDSEASRSAAKELLERSARSR